LCDTYAVMTLDEVRARVEAILAMDERNDAPEKAHGEQDELYVAILRTAAEGHDVTAMAAEALRVEESGGVRWYS
jgi:hypothetical protein